MALVGCGKAKRNPTDEGDLRAAAVALDETWGGIQGPAWRAEDLYISSYFSVKRELAEVITWWAQSDENNPDVWTVLSSKYGVIPIGSRCLLMIPRSTTWGQDLINYRAVISEYYQVRETFKTIKTSQVCMPDQSTQTESNVQPSRRGMLRRISTALIGPTSAIAIGSGTALASKDHTAEVRAEGGTDNAAWYFEVSDSDPNSENFERGDSITRYSTYSECEGSVDATFSPKYDKVNYNGDLSNIDTDPGVEIYVDGDKVWDS